MVSDRCREAERGRGDALTDGLWEFAVLSHMLEIVPVLLFLSVTCDRSVFSEGAWSHVDWFFSVVLA